MLLELLDVGWLLLELRDHLLLRGVHHATGSADRELVKVVLRVWGTLLWDLVLLCPHCSQSHCLLLGQTHVSLCWCLWG